MVRVRRSTTAFAVSAVICAVSPGFAQAPADEPPKIWTVTASAGLALTSGNSDTSTVNAAYDLTPGTIVEVVLIRDRTIPAAKATEDDLRIKYVVIQGRDPNPPKDITNPKTDPKKKNLGQRGPGLQAPLRVDSTSVAHHSGRHGGRPLPSVW